MQYVIIIGHGSPVSSANNLEAVAALLKLKLYPGSAVDCVRAAYMQHARPDFPEVVSELAELGATRIVVHPYFINSGQHVTADVPRMMEEAAARYPGIKFIYTAPLGMHEKLVDVAVERIHEALRTDPLEIETRSFQIIADEDELNDDALKNIPTERLPIVKRIIHTTADFEYAETLVFHTRAVECAIAAIRAGKDILTDVEMVRTGINKRLAGQFGCKIVCGISDEPNPSQDDARSGAGKTRAASGIERLFSERTGIVAVGNAPTALLKIMEILSPPWPPVNGGDTKHDALPVYGGNHDTLPVYGGGWGGVVIGFPVGFVRALEAKMMLSGKDGIPHITNLSRKGGSAVAAAAVNALLKMAGEGWPSGK